MFTPSHFRASSAYKRVGVDTGVPSANPHRLVHMLFEELLQSLAAARGAMQRKEIPEKCALITKAIRIVDEGLKAGLNREHGGELAENLAGLYDYCVLRLIHANARNDESALTEVRNLLEPIAQAWHTIGPKAAGATVAAGASNRG